MIARALRALGYYAYKPIGLPYGVDVAVDVRKLGRPDPVTVIDAGANVGAVATQFARRWPGATIHSFEPIPATFQALTAAARSHARIRPVNAALGRTPGTVAVRPRESVLHSLTDAAPAGSQPGWTDVRVITLDGYCQENGIDRIDFLKTDTEGFDVEVLAGASGLLSAGRVGLVYSEFSFRPRPGCTNTNFFALHEFLTGRGFNVAAIYNEHLDGEGFFFGSALFVNPAFEDRPWQPARGRTDG